MSQAAQKVEQLPASDIHAAFEQQGSALVPGFLSAEWIDRIAGDLNWMVEQQLAQHNVPIRETSEAVIDRLSENLIALYKTNSDAQSWIYDEVNRMPAMHELAASPMLMDYAKIAANSEHLAIHPRLNMIIAMPDEHWHLARWHQDGFYAPHSHVVTYIPLVDTGAHNGGLMIAPGQHTQLWPHEKQLENSKWITIEEDRVAQFESEQLELNAGDLLMFQRHMPHTASVNKSAHVRFALTIRYSNLEDPFFVARGWQWQDLAQEGLKALAAKPE